MPRLPPLPVLSHIGDIANFLLSSLDDATEDACKVVLVVTVFWIAGTLTNIVRSALGYTKPRNAAQAPDTAGFARHPGSAPDDPASATMPRRSSPPVAVQNPEEDGLRRRAGVSEPPAAASASRVIDGRDVQPTPTPRVRRSRWRVWLSQPSTHVGLLVVLLAFPAINYFSDQVGDGAQAVQNVVRAKLGYPPQDLRPKRAAPAHIPFAATVVDDLVEDSFKSVCVYAHARFGMMLAAGVGSTEALLGTGTNGVTRWAVHIAKAVVAVGTPAGEYATCDAYADMLGDWAQRTIVRALRPATPTSKHDAGRHPPDDAREKEKHHKYRGRRRRKQRK